jgi:MoaA/NifB/PqqE/SkfB family radical SAM enzyme
MVVPMSLAAAGRDLRFALGLLRGNPFQVLVQVTNRCNMQCSFCDFWPNAAPREQELTSADYRRLAGELDELGCFIVSIEGGEPLIRKDLPEIVAAFAGRHIPVLFTNGWYVDEGKAAELFAAGLVQVGVSIDYAGAARHDGKRGLAGTTERAWRAVDVLREAAPHGGRQVHVMTVVMDDNYRELPDLVRQSAEHGVGHQFTLLSVSGFRRGTTGPDRLPPPEAAELLQRLHAEHAHVRFFRDYFGTMASFLRHEAMPECRAGLQSFNVDHVGNVAPCIEKIDAVVGNVKQESLVALHRKLVSAHGTLAGCQDCFTACRGFSQAVGGGGSARGLFDLASRMRSQ